MLILTESELLDRLQAATRVSLIQPNYPVKYPPLRLCKIKSYLGDKAGIGIQPDTDLVCISSLFTYNSEQVFRTLEEAMFLAPKADIILGGIFATLMPGTIQARCSDVDIFPGYSQTLDQMVPDLNGGWPIDEDFASFSFVFTTRGCPNHCAYCSVPRLEKQRWLNPTWKSHILPDKKNVMVSDNNLSSWGVDHIADVVDTITGQGKGIVFDNGFDCKLITDEMASVLARGKYTRAGVRMAFDRIEEDGVFQAAVERLLRAGVRKTDIMAYVLFNFTDTPEEANYRMMECRRLGIIPYPQQYTPLNILNRRKPFIGKHWNPSLVRDFRFFWLMAGYYNRMTFTEFLATDLPPSKRKKAKSAPAWL